MGANQQLFKQWSMYVWASWESGQTALSYEDWLETRVADLTIALTPFAAYGNLKHPYAPEAVFTIAHDREGRDVTLLFSDFTRAAELVPNATGHTRATKPQDAAGGIALIAEGSG